ncbi:MAG: hypothetical protein JO316_25130 [Abitibacteriaceae bacterium]|nr:hypothetical protein [Abditibacteriaceae bacterium]MBV9868653.1 hypothetical protein [Abditibacteriaceae bacterium]
MRFTKAVRNLLFLCPALICAGCNQGGGSATTDGTAKGSSVAQLDPKDPKAVEFYQTKIQPILSQSCNGCHGAERHKADLRLDSRDAILKGGKTGPAVVPGDPANSLLIKAVSYSDPNLKMPPRNKLSDQQVADLKHWVELGVPFSG